MRDSRVTLLTPTAINTSTTVYSEAVNLLDGYTGSHLEPTGEYGIGIRVVYTDIVGTAFNVATSIQESSDNSTWYTISTWDTIDPVATVVRDKIVMEKRIRPDRKYIRVVVTTTNVAASGESLTAKADIVDGTAVGNAIRYA